MPAISNAWGLGKGGMRRSTDSGVGSASPSWQRADGASGSGRLSTAARSSSLHHPDSGVDAFDHRGAQALLLQRQHHPVALGGGRAQELLRQYHSYLDKNGDGVACESLRN